ncbi:O-acetyl-ADP-ribose deacetylase [Actinokineospora sp. HUAS TT18]|uniref:O-acetyl-ADP-ribose deacetylase n=1 Tax=Actinokineospora sp. HUAS TT18 TaxID=3447451 RepID=UPI003F525CD1
MRISIVRGDITEQAVDAVVNAANSGLLGGGGVDGAIHARGGPAILAECRALRDSTYPRGLPVGQAVATTAGDLPARWVIHTVGPVHSRTEDRSAALTSAYREALRVADEVGARSVAFPAISAGAYAWPIDDVARIAIRAVRDADTQVEEVRFVLFSGDVHAAFKAAEGPTDDEIAARLAERPDEVWLALFAAADALTPEDSAVKWGGGQSTPTGAIQLPYPIYSTAVNALTSALSQVGAVVVYDWMHWPEIDPATLDQAPVATAARLATKIIRGERFCDGTIEHALNNGSFAAIVARLRKWYENERPPREGDGRSVTQ